MELVTKIENKNCLEESIQKQAEEGGKKVKEVK